MVTEKAQVITIITVFDAQAMVRRGLEGIGVTGFSWSHVDGVGVHGEKHTGLIEVKNLQYVIVASAPLAARVLAWVDRELLPRHPSIAYSTEAAAVTATALP